MRGSALFISPKGHANFAIHTGSRQNLVCHCYGRQKYRQNNQKKFQNFFGGLRFRTIRIHGLYRVAKITGNADIHSGFDRSIRFLVKSILSALGASSGRSQISACQSRVTAGIRAVKTVHPTHEKISQAIAFAKCANEFS